MNKKGLALFMVLGTVLVVVILINIILTIISSQARLTHHQVSRIQAYYAAMAGVNYALEKLRLGNDPLWPATGTYTHTLCRNGCEINDPALPHTIKQISIGVGNPGTGIGETRPVNATGDYTFSLSP